MMRLSLVSYLFPSFQSIPAVLGEGCLSLEKAPSLPPSQCLFLLLLGHRPDGRVVGRTLERRRCLSGAGRGTGREAAGIEGGPRASGAWGLWMGAERPPAVFIPGITKANCPPAILTPLGLPLSAPTAALLSTPEALLEPISSSQRKQHQGRLSGSALEGASQGEASSTLSGAAAVDVAETAPDQLTPEQLSREARLQLWP